MPNCLILQPIHEVAAEYLGRHGVTVVHASARDEASLVALLRSCDAVITRNSGIPYQAVAEASQLKVIAVHGIGTDAVPIELATERGVVVINTPEANLQSVAEHTWALLLAVAKRVPQADRATRQGEFRFKFHSPSRELFGGTLGLVGFGRIAGRVAAMAQAFGVKVLAMSPNQAGEAFRSAGVERVSDLRTLLMRSDFVSLHVPLSGSTKNLIAAPELSLLRPDVILINTSRGAVMDEMALAQWLAANPNAGAGLDVFSAEPLRLDHPLLGLGNVVLTPHSAASSEAALRRMALDVAEGVVDVLCGRMPKNLVNRDVLGSLGRSKTTL
jgi:D-3-phosphoglycerate dehydrogenase